MPHLLPRTLLLVLAAASSSCTYAINEAVFRTLEADTAFDRAVEAAENNCHGVKLADKERSLIYSKWQAWPTSDGIVLSRCLVSMVNRPESKEQEVRVTFAMKQCVQLADLADLDALAEKCVFVSEVPDIVASQLNLAVKAIETAVRR